MHRGCTRSNTRSMSKACRTDGHVNTRTRSVAWERRGKAHRYIREIDYRQMQHKTRLLIGKVIWKLCDLLSDAGELKRNLLREPHTAAPRRWPATSTLVRRRNIYIYFCFSREDHDTRFHHFTTRSAVNAILYAARRRFDVDARLPSPLGCPSSL